MPFGTLAPSAWKRAGSLRKSTTSCSSAFASSAPATCAHSTAESESGVISVGFVLGISFIVRQRKKTSSPMKMIGAHVMIQLLDLVPLQGSDGEHGSSIPRVRESRLG